MTPLLHDAVTFTAEGGGWLAVRRVQPLLRGTPPDELLRLSTQLPGNLRYADERGVAVLIGEVRGLDGAPLDEPRERLLSLLDGKSDADEPPAAEVLEAALDGAGFAWSRRQSCWSVAVRDRLPREVLVGVVPGGARAETVLAEWDEINPASAEALALFLLAAQPGLRFARCELGERQARVTAFADAARLDSDLGHALLGVAAGCELLAREAAALLRPEVASIYLSRRRMP